MDKKLEARIARLEKCFLERLLKNEELDDNIDEIKVISNVLIQMLNILRNIGGSENRDIRDLADSIWSLYGSKLKSYL